MLRRLAPLRFLRDARGASALEFALIAPVMLIMFAGTAEVGQVVLAQRRTAHAVAALGDLSARATSLNDADVQDVFSASNDIMVPLPSAPLSLRLTEVTADANKIAKITWTDRQGSGFPALTPGATFANMPAGLITDAGDVVVVAEAYYRLDSTSTFVLPTGWAFTKRAYLRPRHGSVGRTKT